VKNGGRNSSWWTRLLRRKRFQREETLSPPYAPQRPQRFTVHNVELVDMYSWMQNPHHPDTQQYLREEQDYTMRMMSVAAPLQKLFYRVRTRTTHTHTSPLSLISFYRYNIEMLKECGLVVLLCHCVVGTKTQSSH
jgi:protease II